jgi:DNA-binding NtrC family response regulator
MRTRQLIIWPPDDRLANLLRTAAQSEGWTLCTPRGEAACLRFASRGGRSVLLLGLRACSDKELAFLDHISHRYVRTDVVVIAPSSTAALVPLAWRLGAAMVLTDPWSVHEIVETAAGLLGRMERPFPAEAGGEP